MGKLAKPIQLSPTTPAAPYIGLGFQYMLVNSNVDGVDDDDEATIINLYDDPWDEWVFTIPVALGIDIEFPKTVLGIDMRFDLIGSAESDWEPGGREVSNESLGFFSFGVSFGFKM